MTAVLLLAAAGCKGGPTAAATPALAGRVQHALQQTQLKATFRITKTCGTVPSSTGPTTGPVDCGAGTGVINESTPAEDFSSPTSATHSRTISIGATTWSCPSPRLPGGPACFSSPTSGGPPDDPLTTVQQLLLAHNSFSTRLSEIPGTVDGIPVDRIEGDGGPRGGATQISVAIDNNALIRQVSLTEPPHKFSNGDTSPGWVMTWTLSQFGTPTSIVAPPPTQVQPGPGFS
jgi:hypothetical protein